MKKQNVEFVYEQQSTPAYWDDYTLETALRPPFLSKIKTRKGRRWVLKVPRQSRSADLGVINQCFVLKANGVRKALGMSARLLKASQVRFEGGWRASRGYLVTH